MKKIHIIGVLIAAVAIGVLIKEAYSVDKMVNFAEAQQTGDKVKIVGHLVKDKEIVYDPAVDPNKFTFYMIDKDSVEQKVTLLKAKPTDFEMSEQVTVTGRHKNGQFVASDVLMKCPSKYKDDNVYTKDQL
jgi:cytochrome c-type biogenesis protein CcmE